MSKNLFTKFFVFLLVVGLLFAVAPTKQAQAAAVVTTEAELRTALTGTETEIELGASFTLAATVDVNRSVAIDGKDFTITGPAKGTEAWEGHGLVVTANNVSISNLTITGSGRSNLVFYNVTGGSATNVILSNAAHAGMIVNSSAVTISNVTTTNNTWGGINVDQGSGLTTTPLLTVLGVTTHTSPVGRITPAIWVDSGNAAWVSGEESLYAPLAVQALLYYDNAEFAAATVFNVRTGVKYTTIQAAIDAALAGDAIYVPAGTYAEDVTVAKPLALLGAGRDLVTIQGQLTGEAAALEIKADHVTIDGFKIIGAVGGKKTVRITTATDELQFLNNRVVTASNTGGENAWSGFEVTYGTEQTNHVIDNNIFVGNGTSQLVYYGQNATNIKFTNNTITGTMMTGGLVAGFEGLNGSQVISGNTFDIESTYALFEAYGTYDIVAIFNANTWPDGFIASGNKVVPASVVYPSTNDNNRTQGWAHVDFVSADATAKTITLRFFPNPILGHFVSCFERRTDGDTSQIVTENGGVNYNPLILDGLYPYSCYYGDSGTTYLRTYPVLDYIEIRLPFGAESDERFYWAKFEIIEQVWVDDDFTSATPGWGVDHFAVIQNGINAVAANGIVHVAAGTYEGFSVVGKTGISITGAGDAQTIIAPTTLITTGVGHKYTPNMLASVFVNGSTGITIEGMAIKSTTAAPGAGGADAIVFWNASTGSIKESIVQGIYVINGNQTGQGIAVDGGTSVLSLVNTDISGFQKNGIDVVDGNGGTTPGNLTVNVSGGVITGAGPTTAIAQNGVVYFNQGGGVLGGSITGANISGFDYTPTTSEATGILAYGLGGGTLTVSGNTFGVSEISMTDITGTLNLYTILANNTFPLYSGVFGDSIKVSPTKMLMDPATFVTTDTCTGTREVFVKVQDVTDLVAYALKMTYDKDLITVTNVQNVTLAGQATPGNTFANGVINFGWYNPSGGGTPPTYNGEVQLIKITFQSKGLAGTSAFTILPSSQLEEWPNAFGIPFEVTGGASVSFGSIVTNTSQTKSYCDLAVAVAEAAGGNTLRVDANITSNVSITVDKALTLNTNSLTISRTIATTPNNSFAVVPGGNLTITGGGTITATSGTAVRITGDATTLAKVTLVDATLYAPSFSVAILGNRTYATHDTPYLSQFVMTGGKTNETVILEGNGAEADISGGTLTGFAPIMGNGTVDAVNNKNEGGTKITISGTAMVNGNTNIAIFHPQDGLLTINGGTIIGTNGIEMDAGDLVITGGTIKGTGACLATPVETPEDGSTDTGDAILILHQPGYTPGDQMHVTISGTPTIESTNCYALRELDFGGANSDLALATISSGHFTGGTLGAVYFATNNATNLELVGGDYSADPIAFVYDPYGTYKNAARWYIAPLPVLSSTTFDDQVTLGVATTFSLTVNPSVPGAFSMVFTGYPSETEITYGGTTYICAGSPCVITVPVTLTGTAQTLEFGITVATGGSETPATSYAVAATLHAPAPAYGTTGRDLDTLTANVPVTPGFSVSGIVTMQGRTTRAGVPVTLTWNNTLGVVYGPSMDTDEQAVNFRLTVNYGGTYTITTLQPRYLNITADLLKQVTLTGNYTFANPLWLRAGNAMWQTAAGVYDNTIGVTDAQKVFTTWNTAGGTDALDNSGDVNFDGLVTIKDLTLVGGNMDLTSATAYGGTNNWLP